MSLPETYRSGAHMARVLSSYIACPRRVQREIREASFDAPSIDMIQAMRAAHFRPRHVEPIRPHDGYWPDNASRLAEEANRQFLRRLRAEARP